VNDRLYRTREDRIIGGVAGGVADYFAIDPSLVRIIWALLALFSGGALFLLYIVMWIVIPEEPVGWSVAGAAPGAAPAGEAPTGATGDAGSSGTADATAAGSAASAQPRPTSTPGGLPGMIPPPPPPFSYDWRTQRSMERERRRAARRASRVGRSETSGAVVFGVILVVLGGWFLLQQYIPWLDAGRIWPLILIVIGAVVLLGAIRPRGQRP
jgi:phage shock protein PspC (stress-responsive transcriptional regulator)